MVVENNRIVVAVVMVVVVENNRIVVAVVVVVIVGVYLYRLLNIS